MTNWKEYKLGEIANINMGQSPKSDTYNFEGKGLPFLQGNRTFGRLFPSFDTFCSSPIKTAEVNDILFSVRAPVGDINYSPAKICIGRGLCSINSKKGSNKFLFYLLNFVKQEIISQESGTVFGSVNKNTLENISVSIPDLPTQTAIAEILSSLDDKIELNNKINQELEALAQTLFKQWFIDFDFPNENDEPYKTSGGEMVDSELGEIPKGWKIVDLSSITDKITDGAHASPESVAEGYPMASVKDMEEWRINKSSCRQISESDFKELVQQGCKPLKGDILIAKDGSYLKHVFVNEKETDIVLLSSIAILRPNNSFNKFVLSLYLKEPTVINRLKDIVTGAVIQRIVLKDFRKFKVPQYPQSLQATLSEVLEPLYISIWNNIDENDKLNDLRNILLPKLLSGEIEVGNL